MGKDTEEFEPARLRFHKLTSIEGKTFPRAYPLNWDPQLTEALDLIDAQAAEIKTLRKQLQKLEK